MPTISPIVRLAAAFGALVSVLAAAVPARADIGSYILVDAATGAVLARDNPIQPWYPASITKLMTIYTTFRAVAAGRVKLTSPVTMTKAAASRPPSKMGFKVGTVITVDTAVKILIVKSANDIAVALGEAVGGSEAAFVAEMNAEARRLGMNRTHFNNPHGLPDDGQVTTARDMAILTRALLTDFPEHRDLFRITALQLGKKMIRTHNGLLLRFRGADGMKTGFICNSGFNMVATATRGGRSLIAVVLGAYTAGERNEFAARLLAEGFAAGRGGATVANLAEPPTSEAPPSRKAFACGPKRAKTKDPEGEVEDVPLVGASAKPAFSTSGSRLVVAEAAAAEAPAKRRSYLEPRFETMKPVPIALGGADMGAAAAASPYAAAAAEAGAPGPGGTGAPVPRPRPGMALAAVPGVEPTALAAPDEMVGGELAPAGMAPGFDVGTPAAAAASPGNPPAAPPTVASAAQPGVSVPLSLLPTGNAASKPPLDLTQPTEWLSSAPAKQ